MPVHFPMHTPVHQQRRKSAACDFTHELYDHAVIDDPAVATDGTGAGRLLANAESL